MQAVWLAVAIAATVGYHLVLKLTPAGVNPFLSLAATYAGVTLLFLAAWLIVPAGAAPRSPLQPPNWTAAALAVTIVGLDLGFLLLYRTGFDVSLGQLVTQSVAALALLLLGVALFRERLSLVNVAGIGLCVLGLWLIYRK
ncbi:MAG: hypothetical protein CMLOHMNK_01211 [Steroidobacteraceae bacterium]|nr:hypothetical protein [Steroidobacteraceae bacterium]